MKNNQGGNMLVASPALKPASPPFKRKIVHQLQRSIYLSGLAWAYRKISQPRGALILMYHSVVDKDIAPYIDQNFSVTTEQFESQLRYLKNNANVISLPQLVDSLNGDEQLPERAVVLTFDDGYLNNLTHAAPLLEKYDLPATLYLCTGYIDRRQPQWDDELYSLFQFRKSQKLQWDDKQYDLTDSTVLGAAFSEIGGQLIVTSQCERDRILADVGAQLQSDCELPQLTMGWEEVRSLAERYPSITLGLHTVDHLDVTSLAPEQLADEIERGQATMERELGFRAQHFSYPYGRHAAPIARQLQALGLKSAVITQPTALVNGGTDPFMMPRYESTPSLLDLKLWMSGAFPELGERLIGRVYD